MSVIFWTQWVLGGSQRLDVSGSIREFVSDYHPSSTKALTEPYDFANSRIVV
jgi:hypothetical protein